jgi:hypothetical protein
MKAEEAKKAVAPPKGKPAAPAKMSAKEIKAQKEIAKVLARKAGTCT